MKFLFSAGIVPFFKKGKRIEYLLLQYDAGHWDLPKGKIEKGESKHEAALRELKEEAGITAVIDPEFEHTFSYFFTDYDGEFAKKTVYFFVGKVNSKEITLSHEHKDYGWLPFKKAEKQLTFKNAKYLLHEVHEFLKKRK